MRRLVVAAAVAIAVPAHARANPVDAFGFGARSPAMASAVTAGADDGSANYYNPAILATFPDVRVDVGYQLALPRLSINDQDLGVDTVRGFALSLNVPGRVGNTRVAFGGALFVPDQRLSRIRTLNSQQPRFQLFDNRPQRLFLAANLAVQLTDRLHVGGGVAYMSSTRGGVVLVGRVGFPDAEDSELDLAIDVDLETVRYGQAGVLWRHNDWLDIGVTLRTGFKVTLSQSFLVTGEVGPAGGEPVVEDGFLSLSTNAEDLFQPTQVAIGFRAQLTSRFELDFDATYQRWSTFTNPAADIDLALDVGDFNDLVDIPPAPPLPDPHFADVLVPRVGFELLAADSFDRDVVVRGGYVYEPSPAPEQIGETNFVDNDKHTLSAGAGVTLRTLGSVFTRPVSFDAYLAATFLEPRSNGKLSPIDPVGDYRSTGRVWQAGVGSRWRF